MISVVLIVLPIIILLFLYLRKDQWENEDFESRFGEILAGTRPNKIANGRRWTLLIYPMIFFVRRLIFVAVTFLLADHVTG